MSFRAALPSLRAASRSTVPSSSSFAASARTSVRQFGTSRAAFAEAAAEAAGAGGSKASSRPSGLRKWGVRLALVTAIPAAYLYGAVSPPNILMLLSPRHSPPPPDRDTKQGKILTAELERELQKLFIVEEMRHKEGWYETRKSASTWKEQKEKGSQIEESEKGDGPYARFDPNKVHNSLTAGSLRGPGKLALPPLAFAKQDESEAVIIIHLGRSLCGHDGIIHGGLLATVFDESLARNALMNLPTHIGVTATLTINYRSPCQADQFVVVRTQLDSKHGRKVRVSGKMETLDGQLIAESDALFIEPKWAQFLQHSGVTDALGPPPTHQPHAEATHPEDQPRAV